MKLTTIKRYFEKTIVAIFSSAALALFGSCDIGLGPAVDLTAPEIEITSHKDNDSVGSVFAIRGTATDNEEVTKITIDFADADIHYQLIPGGNWQKKTSMSPDWQTITNDPNYYCNIKGNTIEWSIGVDSSEKSQSKNDNSYTIEASVSDNAGNSGRKSKAICTITIDESNPVVSIYKPELATGKYEDVENARKGYKLKDGNTISRLMNGTLVLQGRQSNAISFKALRIEFDNGKQQSSVAKYTSGSPVDSLEQLLELPEANLRDSETPTVYYSKDLTSLDLREWSLTVKPDEWVNSENGLGKGSHVIRVVSTSLSTSNAWERKILGYFVWYPEADEPWVTAPVGDEKQSDNLTDCYPGASISGSAQDDDGISTIISTVYKLDTDGIFKKYSATGYENPKTHELPQERAKYSAWKVDVPSLNGTYKYEISVKDIYGTEVKEERYFKTSDVSAPKIEINAPLDNSSAILNAKITLFALCWLNPALRQDPSNKIKYLTGSDNNWKNALVDGWRDDAGNIIYRIDDGNGKNSYELTNRIFNLYSTDKKLGFGIGSELNGKKIPLSSQDFIFLASDGTKNTVKNITLTGDSITPSLFTIEKITIDGVEKKFIDGIPNFASKANGKEAVIEGKWEDMLTADIKNTKRIYKPEVAWGNKKAETELYDNGTWKATISSAPNGGGTITATLTDFGGNSKVVQEAASIESTESGLSRIDCLTDDGSYKTGKEISITLEFTKNVDVVTTNGIPTLILNNGGIATYYTGSGSTSHIFKYTVGNEADTEKLYVTKINQNGAKWSEKGSGDDITEKVIIPADNETLKKNLSATRKIKIDNTAPKVKSITSRSSAGYYKKDASLLFMLEFSEDVTITGVDGLNMQFTHKNSDVNVKTAGSTATGSKYVLMTYNVAEGDNASPLEFGQLNASGVTVTDAAGNVLSGETLAVTPTPSFTGFVIDTTKPPAPSFGTWNPGNLVIADDGTSFTLSGVEQGATVEYSLDGGQNWLPYTGKVSITNNGSYQITARQTDKAGNVSQEADVKTFIVNKGALFKRITASSRSGTYTDSKTATPTVITGIIEFRTPVTIEKGAKVTLNVSGGKEIPLEECKNSAGKSDVFTFKYTVEDGDSIANNGNLDVTGWSFTKIKLDDTVVDMGFPAAGNQQRLSENRDIKILTGRPKISGDPKFEGKGADGTLTIKFDRSIEKGIGDIEFIYDDEFHVPTVLTAEEYGELSGYKAISDAYKIGMNGATKSGTTLTNDTSTKYILDYDKNDTDSDVTAAFMNANKHKVVVPIISDSVMVVEKDTLRVLLGETYKLPVKGAKYKVNISSSAVYDDVHNGNDEFNYTFTAPGVEAPQIRLKKTSYTITGTPGQTKTTNANMSAAQTAYMKIDCRTPGATLKYDANTVASNDIRVNKQPYTQNTKTDAAPVREPNTDYTGQVTLGSNNTVNSFFREDIFMNSRLSGKYSVQNGISDQQLDTNIIENRTALKIKDLKVWVIGGDAASGLNSLDPFPLSWGDSSNFKLMQESDRNADGGNYFGNWWWVTWDLSAPACHGFVVGDVPADAQTMGPTMWYAGECAWTPFKENYWLYPGETLIMAIEEAGDYKDNYLFRLKNEGHR